MCWRELVFIPISRPPAKADISTPRQARSRCCTCGRSASTRQFYLFWPVTLVLLRKRPRWVPAGTLFLAGVSFTLNLALVGRNPAQAFYNPATRMWELLAGAALAWFTLNYGEVQRRSKGELLSIAGLALIAAGFFMIDSSKPFPRWWALAPVTGTAMLVRAGAAGWFNRTVLASPPAVFVGLISYPLYLWHWPFLVFAGLLDQSPITI